MNHVSFVFFQPYDHSGALVLFHVSLLFFPFQHITRCSHDLLRRQRTNISLLDLYLPLLFWAFLQGDFFLSFQSPLALHSGSFLSVSIFLLPLAPMSLLLDYWRLGIFQGYALRGVIWEGALVTCLMYSLIDKFIYSKF